MTPIVVITTTESPDEAEKIAKALLDKHLAGCVQLVRSVKSMYWWKGSIESTDECLCLIKTFREKYGNVEEAIKANHSYETPEIVSLPTDQMSPEYREWLESELK